MAFRLVVGLGNPPPYGETRHNTGFWLLDRVAQKYGFQFRREAKFSGVLASLVLSGQVYYLLKPDTYMNLSGASVLAAVRYYNLGLPEVIVVHDDLDIAPGGVRLKVGGGHGGHNGVRDIIQHLKSADFARLRIGIGRPLVGQDVCGYVLGMPSRPEKESIDDGIERVLDVFAILLSGQLSKVQNLLHSRDKFS